MVISSWKEQITICYKDPRPRQVLWVNSQLNSMFSYNLEDKYEFIEMACGCKSETWNYIVEEMKESVENGEL